MHISSIDSTSIETSPDGSIMGRVHYLVTGHLTYKIFFPGWSISAMKVAFEMN